MHSSGLAAVDQLFHQGPRIVEFPINPSELLGGPLVMLVVIQHLREQSRDLLGIGGGQPDTARGAMTRRK